MDAPAVIGLSVMLCVSGGVMAWIWLSARSLMHRARDAARSAGLALVEGTWALTFNGGFVGQVERGAWRVRYLVSIGRMSYTRLRLDFPRPLTFSPLLRRGPITRAVFSPHLVGGFGFGRGLCVPAEAAVVIPPVVRARLDGHPLWARAGLSLNADHIEFTSQNDVIESAADVREAVDVLVTVAEHALALR